jgi:hypothetical protein
MVTVYRAWFNGFAHLYGSCCSDLVSHVGHDFGKIGISNFLQYETEG